MTQSQFMVDFFSKDTTVTVNANELQGLLRQNKKLKNDIKILNTKISILEDVVKTKQERINQLKLNQDKPLHVDLDITV